MDKIDNFADAIRAVLRETADRTDMRGLAQDAVQLLPQHLLYEAAAAHLTSLARKIHNQAVRDTGVRGPSSDEVVYVHGHDARLGETSESERLLLAENRERLAEGLFKRAQGLREFNGEGFVATTTAIAEQPKVESASVRAAERRAEALERMLASLDDLTDSADGFVGKLDARLAGIDAEMERVRADRERFKELAARIADKAVYGTGFRYTIQAKKRVLEVFGLPDTAKPIEELTLSEGVKRRIERKSRH